MKTDVYRIIEIAKKAGEIIVEIYETDFEVEYKKSDSFKSGFSLLTKADIMANSLIENELNKLYPEIPILSEESEKAPYKERKNWDLFWLIDPLDGTAGFAKRNGEFTVNIALVKNKKPILGVVYEPVKKICYFADDNGAFKQIENKKPLRIFSSNIENKKEINVVASKIHINDSTRDFIENLKRIYQKVNIISISSSLKLCLVAEGRADIYPRLGLTSEWDTAAAHAIVNASGKKVYQYGTKEELVYNKENLLNPWFVVE